METAYVSSVPVHEDYYDAVDDGSSSQPWASDKEDATLEGADVRFDDPDAHLEWAMRGSISGCAQDPIPLTQTQTDALTYMVTNPGELYAEVREKLR